jgi:tRNA dimethylallyltransferase
MKGVFFVVGPTAVGKSEIAADVARELDAEVVSADAFQVYRGLETLMAKPDAQVLAKVRHHLIGSVSIGKNMNAEKFRQLALRAINEIHSRGRLALVVGGSGLYVKALTDGLSDLPMADPKLRAQLNELDLDQLRQKILDLDPGTARRIDMKNRRRLIRAIEICLLTGKPVSVQLGQFVAGDADAGPQGGGMQTVGAHFLTRGTKAGEAAVPSGWTGMLKKSSRRAAETAATTANGVFVFRDRDELYQRINQRVEAMFAGSVLEEVRGAGAVSETAAQMIGLREIGKLLEGEVSISQCIAQIQQATRRYAKRQLTWFRRQTKLISLNLSLLTHDEAVQRISQLAKGFGVRTSE